jgi:NitT/TauT family transport system substrate-binding protein
MGGPSTFTMLYASSRFHDANPKAVAAFLQAPEQAIASINADQRAAAQTFIDLEAQSMPIAEVLEVLNDPDIRYTTTPENVMKYADFMAGVDSIKARPLSWQELFFPSIMSLAVSARCHRLFEVWRPGADVVASVRQT